MRVGYTSTALAELGDIFSYIAKHNRVAAARVVAHIEESAARLARFPRMGMPKYKPGVRMIPLRRYPFLVFYTVESDEVLILSVRHAARKRAEEGDAFE
jgi:plasmid stabilization system protein ParE